MSHVMFHKKALKLWKSSRRTKALGAFSLYVSLQLACWLQSSASVNCILEWTSIWGKYVSQSANRLCTWCFPRDRSQVQCPPIFLRTRHPSCSARIHPRPIPLYSTTTNTMNSFDASNMYCHSWFWSNISASRFPTLERRKGVHPRDRACSYAPRAYPFASYSRWAWMLVKHLLQEKNDFTF